MPEKVSHIYFDPLGDVALEVTLENHKIQLVVASNILILASSAFAPMFKSSVKEGLGERKATERPVISLTDDPAEAIILLCNVLHYRMHEVPERLTGGCLYDLAITCDKYGCTASIRSSSALWLQNGLETTNADNIYKLLFAAYVLDCPEEFSSISWRIIVDHVGPWNNLIEIAEHELIAGAILGMNIATNKLQS